MHHLTLGKKIAGIVALLLGLLAVLGILAAWALVRITDEADTALRRLGDAPEAQRLATAASKQYQVQADSIINHNLDPKPFGIAVHAFEAAQTRLIAIADTTEEQAWVRQITEDGKNSPPSTMTASCPAPSSSPLPPIQPSRTG